jgi:hypothetical protein
MQVKLCLLLLSLTLASSVWSFVDRDGNLEQGRLSDYQPERTAYVQQYHGQKDRYCEKCLRNDPEVLVSTPNEPVLAEAYFYHEPQQVEIREVSPNGDINSGLPSDIKVTAQLCDDTSCMPMEVSVK